MAELYKFFLANGNAIELFLATALFAVIFKKNRNFWLKLAVVFCVLFGFSVLWYCLNVPNTIILSCTKYLCMYLLLGTGVWFCTRTSFMNVLFCIVGACATQHGTFKIYSIIIAFMGGRYDTIPSFFIVTASIIVFYLLIFFLFSYRMMKNPQKTLESATTLILAGLLGIFAVFFQFAVETYIDMAGQPALYSMISLYDIICCLFTLWLEYSAINNKKLAGDMEIMMHLIHKQEEQYRVSKENIDMINIKCHDMKHQISMMGNHIDPDNIKELQKVISIYDTSLKTGNEILDVILAEKGLLCERSGIYLECIADGKCIDFMPPSEISSLFGNILDNAIEAVGKVEDAEKRVIGLKLLQRMDMIVIHVENCFADRLVFEDGIPMTTKDDKKYHGFGMRSIKMIAEKYNGLLNIQVDGDVFNLNISIPARKAPDA